MNWEKASTVRLKIGKVTQSVSYLNVELNFCFLFYVISLDVVNDNYYWWSGVTVSLFDENQVFSVYNYFLVLKYCDKPL